MNLQFVEEGGAGGGRRRDGRRRWGHSCHFEKERCDSLEKLETLETGTETERVLLTGVCVALAFYDLLLDFGERIPGNLLVFVVVDSDVRIFSDLVSRQIQFCFLLFFFFLIILPYLLIIPDDNVNPMETRSKFHTSRVRGWMKGSFGLPSDSISLLFFKYHW